ncbi:MAG: hypothetical protein VX897_06530 [Actinomycetota bacterium]|nr:hypothetical protein [Actinomycetota bacterium]MEC9467340.1 hypothetical protein [Actinomycetota bacterium]
MPPWPLMEPDPTIEPADGSDARLAELAEALIVGVVAALPGWVERCVAERSTPGMVVPPEKVVEAGRAAADEVGERLSTLLATDIDEQWTGPLAVIRGAVRFPTDLLHDAGAQPVERDVDAQRLFPDDPYDLTPAAFADVHPALQGPGLAWGAAKAFAHRRRHFGGGPDGDNS